MAKKLLYTKLEELAEKLGCKDGWDVGLVYKGPRTPYYEASIWHEGHMVVRIEGPSREFVDAYLDILLT